MKAMTPETLSDECEKCTYHDIRNGQSWCFHPLYKKNIIKRIWNWICDKVASAINAVRRTHCSKFVN